MASSITLAPDTIASADITALAAQLVHSGLVALAFSRGDTLFFANPAFCHLFGLTGCSGGISLGSLIGPAQRDQVAAMLDADDSTRMACTVDSLQGGAIVEVELRACLLGSDNLHAIMAQDVTDRSRAAARLNLLAFSDPLTGLANRACFADRLREAVLESLRRDVGFAVLMLDLDAFKPVNDRLGHAAGDVVLQHVAKRLQASLRTTETVARLGGDEFAVLLRGIRKRPDVEAVAGRLLAAIRQPILAGSHTVTVGATIGAALFPDHGRTVEHLLVAADSALYAAKRAGGGRPAWPGDDPGADTVSRSVVWSTAYELGVPRMDEDHMRLCELLNALAEALLNGRDPEPAFRDFVHAAARHFADEERLMAGAGYPHAARHREQHQRLLAEIAGLVLDREDTSASVVLRYLQEWLFRHVDGPDREFATHIRLSLNAGEAVGRAVAAEGNRATPRP